MTEEKLLQLLSRCPPPMRVRIRYKLQLSPADLPGDNTPGSVYADAVLQLLSARGAEGLAALRQALIDVGVKDPELSGAAEPCVLILAANPMDTDRLALAEELKLIKDELRQGEQGRRYRVEMELASSRSELSRLLVRFKPTIVHFSGHGTPTGQIVLQDGNGNAETVPPDALVALFDTLKGTEAIVLNACYSLELATALARVVPQVVGMARAIGDKSALRFVTGFYRGLAGGLDYATAFKLGCIEIGFAGLPDAVMPHLTRRDEDKVAVQTGPELRPESVALQGPVRTWRPPSKAAAPEDEAAPRLYPLWYGTNRRPIDPADLSRGFSGERDEQRVYFGTCKVAVPKSHQPGSIGSSWWKRVLTWDDDRLKLVELAALAELDFWRRAREALEKWDAGERRALVFIHGYNVSFEDAALRAAQIGVDLKVPGIMAFYSWPSKGNVMGYPADEATIEACEGHITRFLTHVAADVGAERVDVLAHSMGNRALLRCLQRSVSDAAASGKVPFGQLMLAAPDIDAGLFRELAQVYGRLCRRTTLYVSSKDRALAASGIVHDHPRAGYTPPVTVIDGIDTIEVSNVDLTFLGHGYYAAANKLLDDMRELILKGLPPGARGLANALTPNGEPYWRIGTQGRA